MLLETVVGWNLWPIGVSSIGATQFCWTMFWVSVDIFENAIFLFIIC